MCRNTTIAVLAAACLCACSHGAPTPAAASYHGTL